MEVWNSIWTAISTPNPTLINFCFIPLGLIENALMFLLVVHIFNIKYTKQQEFIYAIILTILGTINSFLIPWPYNTIINYVAVFITLFVFYKMNILKTLAATIFPSIVFSLVGYLLAKPYLSILNITYEQTNTIVIYRIPFACLLYIIVWLLILLIKYRHLVIDIFENIDKQNRTIITINFIFGTFCIIIEGILYVKYVDILPLAFSIFNFICLLIYFILSFYTVTRVSNLMATKEKLESAEAYNNSLRILHDSVRGFKHDFDNIVTTIGGYIKTEDIEGLKNYYTQLEEDCGKVNNLYILNPEIINNPGIYNLLTAKYNEAEEKNIKVNLTFLLDLNDLHMKIYEFARILGILLDNAIDSANECEEKELNIIFRNEDKNNRNIVLIENTYNDKDVNIDEIFNKGITSKENHSGLGLWEIRQILKKNNNLNLHTTKNDKYFSQKLEIYY